MSDLFRSAPNTTPAFDGLPIVEYPFLNLARSDKYARVFKQKMKQASAPFSAAVANRTSFTNLALRSEELGTLWTLLNVTIASNVVANPNDGTVNVDKIVETSASGLHRKSQPITIAAGQPYTFAVAVLPGERTRGRLLVGDAAFATAVAALEFDLTAKTVTATQLVGTPTISNELILQLPDSPWFYLLFTAIIDGSTTSAAIATDLHNGTSYSYGGSTSSGFYMYRPTIVAGSYTRIPLINTLAVARAVSSPDLYPDDPFAFLLWETEEPKETPQGGLTWLRKYGTIPAEHTITDSEVFFRPVMHDINSGSAYAASFDHNFETSTVFTTRKTVGLVGTIDLSLTDRQQLAFSPDIWATTHQLSLYNGVSTLLVTLSNSATALQSAIQTIFGGTVSVTKSETDIQITMTNPLSSVQAAGADKAHIEISGNPYLIVCRRRRTASYSYQQDGFNAPMSARLLTVTAHGWDSTTDSGKWVALWNRDKLVKISRIITIPGANSVTIPLRDLPGRDEIVTHIQLAAAGTRYVNKNKDCTRRLRETFYLPGFTAGIATDEDIPSIAVKADSIAWLGAIIAGDTWPAITAAQKQFLGPLTVKRSREIQMSDALETRSAAA